MWMADISSMRCIDKSTMDVAEEKVKVYMYYDT